MNNKNRYELVLIVDQAKTQEGLLELIEKIKEPILKNKGTMVKEDNWGLKDFAYEIKKQKKGHYYLMQFDLDPEKISEVEWIYRFQREVLRYLLINLTTEKTYFKQQQLNIVKAREEKKRARERELQKATSLGNTLIEVSSENLNDFTSAKTNIDTKVEEGTPTVVPATETKQEGEAAPTKEEVVAPVETPTTEVKQESEATPIKEEAVAPVETPTTEVKQESEATPTKEEVVAPVEAPTTETKVEEKKETKGNEEDN